MTKEQREKLRKLAMAATPGEWDVASDAPSYAIYVKGGGRRIVQTANQNNYKRFGPSNPWHGIGSHSDAAYIASANPQTVIALLDKVDELEAAAEAMGEPVAMVGIGHVLNWLPPYIRPPVGTKLYLAPPPGYVLVPVEPTEAMLAEIHLVENFTHAALVARYKAMLAAAGDSHHE